MTREEELQHEVDVLETKVELYERALKYYADSARYGWWGPERENIERHHWVFDAATWGSSAFHAQPPEEARSMPWFPALQALSLLS